MKFFVTLLSTLLLSSAAFSQSLELTSIQTNYSIGKDSIGSGDWLLFNLHIRNKSSNTVPARVRVDKSQLLPGHRVKFCFASECYEESVLVSKTPGGVSTLGAGQSDDSTFVGDFRADSSTGTSIATFTFFNNSNATDQLDVVVRFNVGLTADVPANDVSSTFSVTPVPASDELHLNLPNTAGSTRSLRIIDVEGRQWTSMEFNADKLTFNSSNLPNGCYAAIVRSSDGSFAQLRFVIAH